MIKMISKIKDADDMIYLEDIDLRCWEEDINMEVDSLIDKRSIFAKYNREKLKTVETAQYHSFIHEPLNFDYKWTYQTKTVWR